MKKKSKDGFMFLGGIAIAAIGQLIMWKPLVAVGIMLAAYAVFKSIRR